MIVWCGAGRSQIVESRYRFKFGFEFGFGFGPGFGAR